MADAGTRFADARQEEIEKRLRDIYEKAQKDIIDRLDAHSKAMYAKDEIMRQRLRDGEITGTQYRNWLRNQMLVEKIWQDQISSAASVLLTANRQANAIIEGERRAVFTENATFQAYQLEHDAGMDLSFTVYDSATVTRLLRDQPELLPPKKIDGQRDKAWNREKIASTITRGIIAGSSIRTIARNIGKETGITNKNAMLRYARTAMTGAQNAGRLEVMHEAQEMGIQVQKEWLATLDDRTREAHALLDGRTADVNEPFDSILGPIDYPGDPAADEANTWNCRCTLTYHYKEYPKHDSTRYDQYDGEEIEDMTFEEWRAAKHPDWIRKNVAQQATDSGAKPDIIQKYQSYEKDKYDIEFVGKQKEYQDWRNGIKQIEAEVSQTRSAWAKLRRDASLAMDVSQEDIEAARAAYEEAKAKLDKAYERMSEINKEIAKYGIENTADQAQRLKIEYLPLRKYDGPFDENAVIGRLAGGDLTKGSCASLGFCYVAQRAGYDVLDFRDGESRSLFSHQCVDILMALQNDGVSTIVGTARSYLTAGKRALEQAAEGKEYYFECGRHAAIVRKTGGQLEYLELQSGKQNGWKPFSKYGVGETLSWRFGADKSNGRDVHSYMLEVDGMSESERFLKIMGYINTDEADQRKGSAGYER